jgi:hypothetical protein
MAGTERNVSIVIRARNEAEKALGSVISSLGTLPGIAAVAGAALAAVGAVGAKLASAASKQEQADVRLAIALASIGQNSQAARARLDEFTAGLQHLTGVEDETIAGVETLFIQLGRLSGDALERATKAALDYAAATGQDVNTAATQMVNVLVKGSGRLQGIATDFDSSASKGERFEQVLAQIEAKAGGAAEVIGQTFSAALKRIDNDYDDLLQQLGAQIVENEAFRGLMAAISVVLKEATGFVKEHSGAIGDLVTMVGRGGLALVKFAVEITAAEARMVSMAATVGQVTVSLASMADNAPAWAKKAFGWTDRDSIDLAKWAAGWITKLGDIKVMLLDAGDAGDEAAGKIQSIIDALGKSDWKKPADGIRNIGSGAGAAKSEIDAFAQVLNDLGIPALEEMEATALAVDEALQMLVALDQVGALSPEEWDATLAAVTEITRQLPQWGEDLSAARENAHATLLVLTEVEEAMQFGLTDAADQFAGAMIDGALGAQISWAAFFRQMLADLLKAIIRATVIQRIFGALGLALGGPVGGAIGSGVGGSFGGGGIGIGGGFVGERLAPVQAFLPGSPAAMGSAPTGAAVGLGASTAAEMGALNMPITILPRRDKTAEAIEMLEEIRTLVERRGYYLPATAVLG